jgi:hypothetical protein
VISGDVLKPIPWRDEQQPSRPAAVPWNTCKKADTVTAGPGINRDARAMKEEHMNVLFVETT